MVCNLGSIKVRPLCLVKSLSESWGFVKNNPGRRKQMNLVMKGACGAFIQPFIPSYYQMPAMSEELAQE